MYQLYWIRVNQEHSVNSHLKQKSIYCYFNKNHGIGSDSIGSTAWLYHQWSKFFLIFCYVALSVLPLAFSLLLHVCRMAAAAPSLTYRTALKQGSEMVVSKESFPLKCNFLLRKEKFSRILSWLPLFLIDQNWVICLKMGRIRYCSCLF